MSSVYLSFYLIPLTIIIKTIECTTTFTFINNCHATIWPAILTNAGHLQLTPTGFQLQPTQTRSIPAPPGWSGRFWARTGCNFDSSNRGSCLTGDCGLNQTECNGSGAAPPATLAEFSLAGPASNKDFYDISLVDGFNLPMIIEPGSSGCGSTGCLVDLNRKCPAELAFANFNGCNSACGAFGKPEFCCSGEFANPNTCKPTYYSEVFKSACPKAYSYAFDDATSTFTCGGGGDYAITFCPDSSSRRKKEGERDSGNKSYIPSETTSVTTGQNGVMWGDNSWLSNLSSGDTSTFLKPKTYVWLLSYAIVQILFSDHVTL